MNEKNALIKTIFNLEGHKCKLCSSYLSKQLSQQPYVYQVSIPIELEGKVQITHYEKMDITVVENLLSKVGHEICYLKNGSIKVQPKMKSNILGNEGLSTIHSRIDKSLAKSNNNYLDSVNLDNETEYESTSFRPKSLKKENKLKYIVQQMNSDQNSLNMHVIITKFTVKGMTCNACSDSIKEQLLKNKDVIKIEITLLTGDLIVHHFNILKIPTIIDIIEDMGFDIYLINEWEEFSYDYHIEFNNIKRLFFISLIISIPDLIIEMVIAMLLHKDTRAYKWFNQTIGLNKLHLYSLLGFILATLNISICSRKIMYKAYKSLLYTTLNMDLLITVAVLISYLSSIIIILYNITNNDDLDTSFETANLLISFVLFGKLLDNFAKKKTMESIKELNQLKPERTIKIKDEKETYIYYKDIQINDHLKVNKCELFPCDGKIIQGKTTVDESMLTGEAYPILKQTGDLVIGSTRNITNEVIIKAEKIGKESIINQIIKLIKNAQKNKADIQIFADRISNYFIPFIIILSIATFIIWLIIINLRFYKLAENQNQYIFCLYIANSVLVIACPCALGLASPAAIMVGTQIAAKIGILIKGGGKTLELAHKIPTFVFDKTGTLTSGNPMVTDVVWMDTSDRVQLQSIVWTLLSILLQDAYHPLSKAIYNLSKTSLNLFEHPDQHKIIKKIIEIEEIPGKGFSAIVQLAEYIKEFPIGLNCSKRIQIVLGSPTFLLENGIECTDSQDRFYSYGKSMAFLGFIPTDVHAQEPTNLESRFSIKTSNNESTKPFDNFESAYGKIELNYSKFKAPHCSTPQLGFLMTTFAIMDPLRPEAKTTIDLLSKMNKEIYILSGDNYKVVSNIAQQLGIKESNVIAEVFPKDKLRHIKELQLKTDVIMIGDGINDSAALAQANIGISLQNASQIAISTADVILLKNKLLDIINLVDISQLTLKRIKINFIFAIGYNLLAIPVAAGVFLPVFHFLLPPPVAAFLMLCSSVSVLFSSWLLKLSKPKH